MIIEYTTAHDDWRLKKMAIKWNQFNQNHLSDYLMLNIKSEYTGQNADYWHNYVLQKSNHNDHVIYRISGVFYFIFGYKSFSILINFENFLAQNHDEISQKLSLKRSKQGDTRSWNW